MSKEKKRKERISRRFLERVGLLAAGFASAYAYGNIRRRYILRMPPFGNNHLGNNLIVRV